jgi:hypothetical protein
MADVGLVPREKWPLREHQAFDILSAWPIIGGVFLANKGETMKCLVSKNDPLRPPIKANSLVVWLIVLLAVGHAHCSDEEAQKKVALQAAIDGYARFAPKLAPTNLPFSSVFTRPFELEEFGIDVKSMYFGEKVYVYGRQFGFSFDAKSLRMESMSNPLLREYVKKNYVQKIPELSVAQALDQARSYLKLFDVNVDKDIRICKIDFDNVEYKSWLIYWVPCYNGYDYDPMPPYDQHVSVWFNEKYGFWGYSDLVFAPPPKQTIVNVTKEAAIVKASKVVPLIQRSPYYLQCRLPGFAVSSLRKAELLVSAPNWLLDPERAIWLRDKPPEETRLCWVVTFASVYTGKEEPGKRLVPPMFFVYIDAATGEIVGANFS